MKHNKYNVYRIINNVETLITTVYFKDSSTLDVKVSLVNHDGYPNDIIVKKVV